MRRCIYKLTKSEIAGLNPPERRIIYLTERDACLIDGGTHLETFFTERQYEEVLEDFDNWLPVGYIPAPRTRCGWFFYHLIHGIWMRYPLWKVILYALFES